MAVISLRNRVPAGSAPVDASIGTARVNKGPWDPSIGSFPSGAEQGWEYLVVGAGTMDSVKFLPGDMLVALIDNPSTTTYTSNWVKIDNRTEDDAQQVLVYSAAVSWVGDSGRRASLTMTGDATLSAITNPRVGEIYSIVAVASGGARTLSFAAQYLDPTYSALSAQSIPNGESRAFAFIYDGNNFIQLGANQAPLDRYAATFLAGAFVSGVYSLPESTHLQGADAIVMVQDSLGDVVAADVRIDLQGNITISGTGFDGEITVVGRASSRYALSFTTTDFSSGLLTITAAVHGVGTDPIVQVRDSLNDIVATGVNVNASGDVAISGPFDGRAVFS